MGMLDEHADTAVDTPHPYGLWAPMEEKISRTCSHFSEAVEPTVDPGLLVEAQTYDEGGMPLIGSVVTECSNCLDGIGECLKNLSDLRDKIWTDDKRGAASFEPCTMVNRPIGGIVAPYIKNDVEEECKKYEKSEADEEKVENELSSGLTIVRGCDMHQGLTGLGPLRTLATAEEGLMHENPQQLQRTMESSRTTTQSPVSSQNEAWLNRPIDVVNKDYEKSMENDRRIQKLENSEQFDDANKVIDAVARMNFEKFRSNGEVVGKDFKNSTSSEDITATVGIENTKSIKGAIDAKDVGGVRDAQDAENVKDAMSAKEIGGVNIRKEILYKQFQTAPSNREFESNNEQGRPTHSTRPSRFRDEEFETRFRLKERRQRSLHDFSDPGSGKQENVPVNFLNFHRHKKKLKQEECNHSGRGVQKRVRHSYSLPDTVNPAGAQQHTVNEDRLKDGKGVSSAVQMRAESQPSCDCDGEIDPINRQHAVRFSTLSTTPQRSFVVTDERSCISDAEEINLGSYGKEHWLGVIKPTKIIVSIKS